MQIVGIAKRNDESDEFGELVDVGTVGEFDALPTLLASVTACVNGDRHCTIYSSDSGSTHRTAMWLSASGDSFVSLAEMY